MTNLSILLRRMGLAHALGAEQESDEWLSKFKLRPPGDLLNLQNPNLQRLHSIYGVTSLELAKDFIRKVDTNRKLSDQFGMILASTRDLCWHLSWLVEVLEGRYEEDVPAFYGDDLYLNCRYGVKFYNFLWHYEEF